MNILVTGGTGFIGRHLCMSLLRRGHHVRCLARNIEVGPKAFQNEDIELVKGDLTQPETLRNVAHGIDAVYHLAAAGHVSEISRQAFKHFSDINVQGTKNLISLCAREGVKRIIHFSSTAAIGLPKQSVISEETLCTPQTPYQKSKLHSEAAAFSLGRRYNIQVIVLRPCLVYGPGGTGEFLKICKLIKKGVFPRIGMGRNLTPIVHVADVVQAAVKGLEKGASGKVFIIASNHSPPLKELHKLICEALGIRRIYFYVPLPIAYLGAFFFEKVATTSNTPTIASRKNILSVVKDRTFDISRAKNDLRYRPAISLSKGIRQTVSWLTENNLI